LTKSEPYLKSTLIRKEDCFETSIYTGKLTNECVASNVIKLNKAFPTLDGSFFDVFSDRIKDNKYNDSRLNDAVNHVIDNCIYPSPTIAQFISFDKMMKLYTYDDVLKMNDLSQSAFKEYRPVRIGENTRPMYARLNDIEQYNLTKWVNE